jgi:hypothetical protein
VDVGQQRDVRPVIIAVVPDRIAADHAEHDRSYAEPSAHARTVPIPDA